MRLARLAGLVLGVATAAAACDPTGPIVQGISRDGGGAQRVLFFAVQPSNAIPRNAITPPVQVAARDTLGSTDTSFAGSVTVSLGANPTGAFLDGTVTAVAVSGVATFGEVRVDRAGSGYTLVARASGATAATSAPFNVTAP